MIKKISIVILVILIGVGGYGAYNLIIYKPPSLEIYLPANIPVIDNNSVVYTNTEEGYLVRLPSFSNTASTTSYVLSKADKFNGVKFTIPEIRRKGTNLSGDTYISIESQPTANPCSANIFVDGTYTARTIVENSVEYSVIKIEDAGAGNRYEELVYAIPSSNRCLAVRYSIHYTVVQNYPEGAVVEFNRQALMSDFDSIRNSLVITQ